MGGGGKERRRQRLAKSSVRGVAAASVWAAGRCEGFIGGLASEIRTHRRQKMRSSGRERTSFERAVFILAAEPPREKPARASRYRNLSWGRHSGDVSGVPGTVGDTCLSTGSVLTFDFEI